MAITIKQDVVAEITEKKSRFIANIVYIESKEQAEEKIREIKKKYYDAKHHCFAFRILEEDRVLERSSDDGEPSGTAGSPMRNILEKKDLVNVLVVVTRYFGGILLGTGGLVRAYTQATQSALEKAEFVKEEIGYEMEVEISYADIENWNYYCTQKGIFIVDVKYEEKVTYKIQISVTQRQEFLENIQQGNVKFLVRRFTLGKEKKMGKM